MEKRLIKKLKHIRLIYYLHSTISLTIFSIILNRVIYYRNDSIIIIFLIFYSITIVIIIFSTLIWMKLFDNITKKQYLLVLKFFKILSKTTLLTSSVFVGYGLMQSQFNFNGEFSYKNNDIEVLVKSISKKTTKEYKLKLDKIKMILKPLKIATILNILNYLIWCIILGLYLILIINYDFKNVFIITSLYYLPLYLPADTYYSSGIIYEIWYDIKYRNYDLLMHNFLTHFNNDLLLGNINGIYKIQPRFLKKTRSIFLYQVIEDICDK